jgi:hypothetical protein
MKWVQCPSLTLKQEVPGGLHPITNVELSCMYCHLCVYDTYVMCVGMSHIPLTYSSCPLWSGGDKFYIFYRYRRFYRLPNYIFLNTYQLKHP